MGSLQWALSRLVVVALGLDVIGRGFRRKRGVGGLVAGRSTPRAGSSPAAMPPGMQMARRRKSDPVAEI